MSSMPAVGVLSWTFTSNSNCFVVDFRSNRSVVHNSSCYKHQLVSKPGPLLWCAQNAGVNGTGTGRIKSLARTAPSSFIPSPFHPGTSPNPHDLPAMVSRFAIVTLIFFFISTIFVIHPVSFHVRLPVLGRRKVTIGLMSAPILTIALLWAAQCLGATQIRNGIVGTGT